MNSATILPACPRNSKKRSGGCLSNNCSEMPSLSTEKDCNQPQIENDSYIIRGDPITSSSLCNNGILGNGSSFISEQVYPPKFDISHTKMNKHKGLGTSLKLVKCLEIPSKSGSNIAYSGEEVEGLDVAHNNSVKKLDIECYVVNDSSSSSKSNIELGSGSMKNDMDDTGECSSSEILTTNMLGGCLAEKELESIFRGHGLLQKVCRRRKCTSIDVGGTSSAVKCNFQSCKICDGLENPAKMLICDNCEEAFHISCCNPRIRKIPDDEWYCQPCSRKKRKLSSDTTSGKSVNAMSEASKDELDHIAFMLSDVEPYTTGVRIGKAFQADVPDWSGPVSNDVDCVGETLGLTECDTSSASNANKFSASSSTGNWLQCREVLDGSTEEVGTICGKWRRAPLFEVQTDDWDCSCAVVWDPVHSDCAVPQELSTDQVLKQLKYIEMLRPRLVAKKGKLSRTKSDADDFRSVTSKHVGDP